jgi:hypothetical protein
VLSISPPWRTFTNARFAIAPVQQYDIHRVKRTQATVSVAGREPSQKIFSHD